ncbi:hypothetical protein ABFA07_022195 [Porites harrisoni]
MAVRRAVFIQSLIVVVYVLFNKQACTSDSCDSREENDCEQLEPSPGPVTDVCKTTRRCLDKCQGSPWTKHEETFDKYCGKGFKCCALAGTGKGREFDKF